MQKSEQINELAAALSKAQSSMEAAKKDSTNTFYQNSPYASLPEIWAAAKQHLTANNLAVTMLTDTGENGVVVETMLMHSSGQWVASCYPVKPTKDDPQGLKSALTYARRASLECIANIVAEEEDDDGEIASGGIPWTKAEGRAEEAAQRAIEIIGSHKTRPALEKWMKGAETSMNRLKRMDEDQYDRVRRAYNIAISDAQST